MEEEKEINNVKKVNKDKEEKIKEAKVKEVKEKNKLHKDKIIIIIFIVLSLIAVVTFIVLDRTGLIKNNKASNEGTNITLKHTATNDNYSEGIYMTDVSDVVEEVMPSIVAITSKTLVSSGTFGPSFFNQNQYSEGAGSGIIVGKSDTELMILTNNHVVEGAEELTVKFIDDKSVDATIKGTSERKDMAIIAVKLSDIDSSTLENIKIATIGDSSKLKVGQGIIAIGNALGYGQSVTTGVVSAIDREVTTDNYTNKMIQIDAAINGGNSGGALLNAKGEVVGINSLKYSSGAASTSASVEGMGFAIPISDVSDLIEDLINGKEAEEGATLGVEGYMTTSMYTGSNLPTGFYISGITSNSGADKAGLEIGNIITAIDGTEVEKFSDLSNVIYDKKKGDKVTLKIAYVKGREYKEKEVEAVLS